MKLARLDAQLLSIPEDEPLADAPERPGAMRPVVALRMETADGTEGIGLSFYGGALSGALREAVEALGKLALGEDPRRPEAIAAKLRAAAGGCEPGGIFTLAAAAIDLALWDIKGKSAGLPIWKLLGGAHGRVPTYASGALRRGLTHDQAATAAAKLKARGFTEMKMQLALPGHPTVTDEVTRARVIRDAIGPDIRLMCDINQRWRVEQAIDIGRRIEDVGLFWLEDVTAADDFAGIARINAALATPIAGGEYLWGVTPHRHAIEARAVDYVMVDLVRAGGVTPWLKIAGMAEAFNLPIVSHVIPEFHCQLIGAIPNGLTVEYMPWMLKLFTETPPVADGHIVLPETPGWGLTFDPAALARFRVG
ncbi:MAG: mandelate racemase/muconate lactonizing enzyme family protein [Rhodospirillales bacterium]|nr:mandelate racemase/muconate lactonizing enzyme family protein [Rhodospirillales bacterium]